MSVSPMPMPPIPPIPPMPPMPVAEPGQTTTEYKITALVLATFNTATGLFIAAAAASVIHPSQGLIVLVPTVDTLVSGLVVSAYSISRGTRKALTNG